MTSGADSRSLLPFVLAVIVTILAVGAYLIFG